MKITAKAKALYQKQKCFIISKNALL